MWPLAALICVTIGLLFVIYRFREIIDLPTRVLLSLLWLRYALQAFPDISIPSRVAGLSLNALVAVGTTALLFAIIDSRYLKMRSLLPTYAIVAIILVSGLFNKIVVGTIDDTIKFLYFITICLFTIRAFHIYGADRSLRALLSTVAFIPIILIASIALDQKKNTELDGSVSYIGGFFHETIFSTSLLTFFFISCMINWKSKFTGFILAASSVIGIFLTNYRTTVIAMLPLFMIMVVILILRVSSFRVRAPILVMICLVGIVSFPPLILSLPERYSDILVVLTNMELIGESPRYLSDQERRLFSGRVFIWAIYFDAWYNGSTINQIIGLGPNAHDGRIFTLAHNSFLSYLYEFGIVGFIALIAFFSYNIVCCLRVSDREVMIKLLGAHFGFVLFNLATNGLWSVEGFIFYAIVTACTWYAAQMGSLSTPKSAGRRIGRHPLAPGAFGVGGK